MRSLKIKTKLEKTSLKTLMSFFQKKSNWFFNFSVDILFSNEHVQLKKMFKLKNTSVKTFLNDVF